MPVTKGLGICPLLGCTLYFLRSGTLPRLSQSLESSSSGECKVYSTPMEEGSQPIPARQKVTHDLAKSE